MTRRRDLGPRRHAEPRRARRDGSGARQQDLHRAPGRQARSTARSRAITPQGLVVVQEVNDPLSLVSSGKFASCCDRSRTPRNDCDAGPCPVSDRRRRRRAACSASGAAGRRRTAGVAAEDDQRARPRARARRSSSRRASRWPTSRPRPDPLTLLARLPQRRRATASPTRSRPTRRARSPRVAVEAAESLGAPASRVRITLSQPVAHHVRSERNTIVVDFDKPSAKAAPYVAAARRAATGPAPDAMLALRSRTRRRRSDRGARPGRRRRRPSARRRRRRRRRCRSVARRRQPRRAAAPQPQPQPPAAADAGRSAAAAARGAQFTGHPVSLDFQGADLRAVLRTFAEISGLNIVIDPAVQGTVDVALRDVPWDQALDIILRANKLGYSSTARSCASRRSTVLADEETQRRKLADEQALAGELRVLTQHAQLREGRGTAGAAHARARCRSAARVQVDPRTNTLIITRPAGSARRPRPS